MPDGHISSAGFAPVICAHRGLSEGIPENSLVAVKESLRIARAHPECSFFIELDVRSTADGTLVIMHDSSVTRTTGAKGFIEDMSLDEVGALTLLAPRSGQRGSLHINASDLAVPKLDDVMALVTQANAELPANGRPVGIALEIKPEPFLGRFRANAWSLADAFLSCASRIAPPGIPVPALRPPSKAVKPLAECFNRLAAAGNLPPCHVFSSAGLAGRRDIAAFHNGLSEQARAHFEDMAHETGEPDVSAVLPGIFSRMGACAEWLSPFSVLRDRRYGSALKSSFLPLNGKAALLAGLEGGRNWITTETPALAAELSVLYYSRGGEKYQSRKGCSEELPASGQLSP